MEINNTSNFANQAAQDAALSNLPHVTASGMPVVVGLLLCFMLGMVSVWVALRHH